MEEVEFWMGFKDWEGFSRHNRRLFWAEENV